jgi:sulfatase modifying factor 1
VSSWKEFTTLRRSVITCVQVLLMTAVFGVVHAQEKSKMEIVDEVGAGEKVTRASFLACHAQSVEGMSCVPGGPFIRGSEKPRTCGQGEVRRIPRKKPNHRPVQTLVVSTFYMDQTEVTFSAYQACAKAGKCRRTRPYYNDYDAPDQPMVGMTWFDANQYCKAQGKRLPTEAEWEKAARGSEGELFPWGAEKADCKRAVIMGKKGRSCGVMKKKPSPWKGKTLPVRSRAPGRYGLYDMIGNAEEWTADWYSRDWSKCGEDCARRDPKGPCGDQSPEKKCRGHKRKVVRGGSWYWPTACAKSWTRRPHFPKNKPYHHFGFRCAADWQQAKALIIKEL